MTVDTTDDKEPVVTKAPIDTNKPSHIDEAPTKTYKPSPSAAVPVVTTRSSVEIVTGSRIDKGKTQFQPINTTVLPSAKVPASLS